MAVEFEEQGSGRPVPRSPGGGGAITNLVFKLGLAKNPTQANIIMVIIAVIALGIAVYLVLPTRSVAPLPGAADNALVEPGIP